MSNIEDYLDAKRHRTPAYSGEASLVDAYKNTLQVYNDASFAEMYFRKWGSDLPRTQLDAFAQLIGASGIILDAGCGPGHHTQYLYARGQLVVGLDLSLEALRIATAHFTGPCFVQCDMLRTPFADSAFAGIWACASLIHLPEHLLPIQLGEFRRLLTLGGVLALTLTVGQQGHFDSFGRFFQSSPDPKRLSDHLMSIGMIVDHRESRLLTKTTEGGNQTVEWVTLTVRKVR